MLSWHRTVSGVAIAVISLVAAPVRAEGDRVYDEARVKAEFVERFCRFVDWPDTAFPAPGAPFVIAVFGTSPVSAHLEEVARRYSVKGRRFDVRNARSPDDARSAQVVWISADGIDNLDAVLSRTHARPVLTVVDARGAAERGALIDLHREGPYVRFDINLSEVRASGLRFSSKLLRLGTIVGPDAEVPR
jgi:hypothetical protein